MMSPVIAILTDFGVKDIYVGVMKGVMMRICPQARLIDLTHEIPPQQVRQGALALHSAYRYFPEGTVFLVVVDPGVGSKRRPVAVQAGKYGFVAPDNGVLHYTLDALGGVRQAVELDNPAYQLAEVSRTFHGRDIFAPAASHMAAGVPLSELGTSVERLMPLALPSLHIDRHSAVSTVTATGEVIQIDHFGNITTSIGTLHREQPDHLRLEPAFIDAPPMVVSASGASVKIGGWTVETIHTSYSETQPGDLLALVGSSGYLEIAVNQGSAAERLGVVVGDRVELKTGEADAAVRD